MRLYTQAFATSSSICCANATRPAVMLTVHPGVSVRSQAPWGANTHRPDGLRRRVLTRRCFWSPHADRGLSGVSLAHAESTRFQ
jgi:hypothetical protein